MEMFLLPFWTLGSNETGATPSLTQLKSVLFDLQFQILCYFFFQEELLGNLGCFGCLNFFQFFFAFYSFTFQETEI